MFHQHFSSDFFFEIPVVLEVITSFRWVKSLVLKSGARLAQNTKGERWCFILYLCLVAWFIVLLIFHDRAFCRILPTVGLRSCLFLRKNSRKQSKKPKRCLQLKYLRLVLSYSSYTALYGLFPEKQGTVNSLSTVLKDFVQVWYWYKEHRIFLQSSVVFLEMCTQLYFIPTLTTELNVYFSLVLFRPAHPSRNGTIPSKLFFLEKNLFSPRVYVSGYFASISVRFSLRFRFHALAHCLY